jgi:hypothetical protein
MRPFSSALERVTDLQPPRPGGPSVRKARRSTIDRPKEATMTDHPPAPERSNPDRERRTEPLDHGLPSVDEPDEADGPMEEPADAFRSREEIERLRRDEGPAGAERASPSREP